MSREDVFVVRGERASLLIIRAETLGELERKLYRGIMEHGRLVLTEDGERTLEVKALLLVEKPLEKPLFADLPFLREEDLEAYAREVILGEDWLRMSYEQRSSILRKTYTYYQRLRQYPLIPDQIRAIEERKTLDQLEKAIEKLRRSPNTRRCQLITWHPAIDLEIEDPPCLQSIWLRILDGKLDMEIRFRSWDAWKGLPYNLYAFSRLMEKICRDLDVEPGHMLAFANSLHIYERDWSDVREWLERRVGSISFFLESVEELEEEREERGEKARIGEAESWWDMLRKIRC